MVGDGGCFSQRSAFLDYEQYFQHECNTRLFCTLPDLACFNGLWHVYYAYSAWGTIDSAIGVATSPSLTNAVWTDQGKVIESPTDIGSINCIDPSIYVAANGAVWMSFGSYSDGIMVMPINPATGMALSSPVKVASSTRTFFANTTEGSCIYQHGGYWYLFLNYGGCCDTTYSTYNIRVGRGGSPNGPYYDKSGVNMTNGGGTVFLEKLRPLHWSWPSGHQQRQRHELVDLSFL